MLIVATSYSLSSFAQETTDKPSTREAVDEEIEVIEIKGVYGSLRDSMNDKRFSTEIKDSISAEDIGQLPDENIAEALQRVTGIQMARSADGEGSTLQIRGISDNNVEINGQTVSGSSADRSVNFQDLPSELFSAIEILKAPTADTIEGSIGGTVNLKTRRPLDGKKDAFASVTAKAKYVEIAEQTDPDINVFLKRNWRDTQYGDFGVIVNLGMKTVTSVTEAYGGGDFEAAPATWTRRSGDWQPVTGANNANGANLFHPSRGAGAWQFDPNVDVNGDNLSNENDRYYIPSSFGFFENTRDSDRNSFNTTLQWQPNNDVNLFLDVTLTDIEEVTSGSRYSVSFNAPRVAPLLSGNNLYQKLADIPGASEDDEIGLSAGEVYYMTAGRLGNASTRMGASPSLKIIDRESQQFTFGGDWQINDTLNVALEISTSEGSDYTREQGALIMGIDYNGNGQLAASDFAQFVDFDSASGRIPNVYLYQAPFAAPAFDAELIQPGEEVEISPTDPNYERLSYFQFNRVAADTKNKADSLRLDFTLDLDSDVFTQLMFGVRASDRSFARAAYQNGNQRSGPSSLWTDGDELRKSINVQQIRVNPDLITNESLKASSELLNACLVQGGDSSLLSDDHSNLPRTWTTTNCSAPELSQAFGLQDIRTIDEETGIGIYEQAIENFLVEEETLAAYFRADYFTELFGLGFFGNLGLRYVETDTDSTGIVPLDNNTQMLQTFSNSYDDWLPSLNANLSLNNEMVIRLGLSRTLGRPGLREISPSVDIRFDDTTIEGIDGFGNAGNPYLDPEHSNNIDVSYEWYYSASSMFSLAYYRKDIDSTIEDGPERIPFDIGDKTYLVTVAQNLPGTVIDGYEIAIVHGFTELSSWLKHTGVGFNYTFTDEASELIDQEGDPIARQRLSEHSYNMMMYYDDGTFSTRLAYNWRDEFVRRVAVDLGFGRAEQLPEIEAARGQLDLTANYTVNEHIKINFAAVNLTDSETERFMKYEQLTNYIANAGRRYTLGLVYRF